MSLEEGGFIYQESNFRAFNVPGATSTTPFGINDAGQIVGLFADNGGNQPGFLYSNGGFSTLDFQPAGIDNRGQIVVGDGDEIFTITPEPASLLLFGAGLIGITTLTRRRPKKFAPVFADCQTPPHLQSRMKISTDFHHEYQG